MGRPLQQARRQMGGYSAHRRRHGGGVQLRMGVASHAHDWRIV